MPPTYGQNKIHIYKYRLNHIDKVREINKLSKRKRDCWKKITREFNRILL